MLYLIAFGVIIVEAMVKKIISTIFCIFLFLVSDESGVYTYIEDWDVEASFDEKAGKYGMLETHCGHEL